MKKILTLLFAVVTVAAFALPAVQMGKKLQPQKSDVKIEKITKKAGEFTRKSGLTKDAPAIVTEDTAYLNPKGAFFSAFFPYNNSFWYRYNMCLVPGNTELTWTNMSIGVASDTYDWVYYNPSIDEDHFTLVEGENDLVCTFPNYPGWLYPPMLFADGYNEDDDEAENYYTFSGALFMGGKWEDDVLGDGTVMTTMYQFDPYAEYYDFFRTSFGAGYGEDANTFFEDLPDGYKPDGAVDGKITRLVQRFDYPGKPYAFSHIQMYAYCTADADQKITAKVCKIEDGFIDMDNPIATSVYIFPAAAMGETMAINFYFEKMDPELGLTQEDWLIIDTDMAIVIDGVNDVEEIKPIMCAVGYTYDQAHDEIYDQYMNGYGEWEFYDEAGEVVVDRFLPCHLGYYWGDDYYLPIELMISINAQFAYIETVADNATEYTIPTEGGEFTLKLKASEPFDAWYVEEIPEWINVEAVDSMRVDEDGNESYSGYTTLTVNVEPNNNGQIVYTLPGTSFTINVGEVATPYYLVGTFNEWSQQTGMLEFVDNEGVLETEAELEAGAEFKVITPNGDGWTWYGGQDDNGVGYFLINDGLMNTPITLVDGANFRLEKAGKYTFQLDPTAMTLTVVPEAAPVVPGDVNGDGNVTAADVTCIYNYLLNGDESFIDTCDVNGDGNITSADVTFIYNILLGN